ncbi:hypothetical protein PHSC3_000557 [Chlamydiales bacterium STE3]|nr:hypothetical protein PHSC3_000557 [Chlamydiales bacterium STE3]
MQEQILIQDTIAQSIKLSRLKKGALEIQATHAKAIVAHQEVVGAIKEEKKSRPRTNRKLYDCS